MADLAIIVPTRGRPQNIARVIDAWNGTYAWAHADLIVVYDLDDPELPGYQAIPDDVHLHNIAHYRVDSWLPMVYKLDQAARYFAGDYFALGFAGDDHLPRTVGWSARYLEVLRELGTGIVYGDDGYQGEKLCTEWAMTSDIVRALGRMVPAKVEHMYSDVSVLELGQAASCIRHLPGVSIEHVHPYAGKTEMDPQYRRVNSREQFRKDRQAYQRWQRLELPSQTAVVRSLMPAERRTPDSQPSSSTRVVTTLGLGSDGEINPVVSVRVEPPLTTRPTRKVNNMSIPRRLLRVRGATPPDVAVALADLAAQVPAHRAIVELGVFQGFTSIIMGWGASQGGGAHVWGIDPWDLPGNDYGPPFTDPGSRNWARYNVKAQGMADRITLVQGFSLEQAEKWAGPEVGLLFMDDDHSYDAVRRNLQEWGQHLADDAVIAFDDYGHPDWPGVKEAVDDMVADGVLEPVQVFHDRLAVTRLGQARIEQVDQNLVRMGSAGLIQRGGVPFPALDGWIAPTDHGVEPAGKTEPVDLDPPAEPGPDTEPAGKTEPVDLDPDPNVAVARETVLAGEVDSVPTQTTLDQLTVAQLRDLAKARNIRLGARKDRRDAALAALRAGR